MAITLDGTAGITSPVLSTPDFLDTNSLGMRNRLINGAMAIDQRNAGTSQTITAAAALAYTVDRWYAYCTGANVTGQQVAGTIANTYNYRFTGAASVTAIGFAQRIEAINSADLAGTTATLSVNLANSVLTTVTWTAYYANTTDTFGTLASPTKTLISSGTFTVNSTLSNYSTQISIPSAATTGIEIVFTVGAQTSGTWTIGNVQFEAGTVSTPFERRLITQELTLCQRYYEKSYEQSTKPGTVTTVGCRGWSTNNGGYAMCAITYIVTKRAIATAVSYSTATGATGVVRNVSGVNADWSASTNNAGSSGVCFQTGAQTANAFVLGHYTAEAEIP